MKKLIHPIISLFILTFLLSACRSPRPGDDIISLEKGWKIQKGDNPEWALPGYDASGWQSIDPHKTWETQLKSFSSYDGYAWYRINFILPKELKDNAYFGDSLQISLGRVDDTEQTFLNGQLLGQNNVLFTDTSAVPGKFEGDSLAYSYYRKYVLPVDDPRLKWGKLNILAVRVHDHGGGGGITNPSPSVSMVDIKDYLAMNVHADPFELKGENYIKTIRLINGHHSEDFDGELTVRVTSNNDGSELYESTEQVIISAGEETQHMFTFSAPQTESYKVEYIYNIDGSVYPVYQVQGAPYILTPPAPDEPRINGPAIFGVRPGHPLLYTIPASGIRPMVFSSDTLPPGIMLDSTNGFLRGEIRKKGEYNITLTAANALGEDSKIFTIRVGDTIQLTPPMGWNSWNCWGLTVSDEKVRSSARAMVESGLVNYGWSFMNIDDGWEADERTRRGELLSNEKFPDMNALSDYIHGLGLKLGIYSSPGPLTCGGYLGSYKHEYTDARTWADWGIDYLKHDWCSYRLIAENETELEELQKPYIIMRNALDRVNRDIVYSLCQYGMGDVSSWGADVGGNLWRTTYDIVDTWESLTNIGFSQYKHSSHARPGGFNDPDMMIVGWVGWGPDLHPTRLTADEQYTHVSLWCLLSAPLLLGNDLSRLDDFTISLLTNNEVLEVNQDALCDQADRVYNQDSIQVWIKDMADGSKAVGFFNMDEELREISIPLGALGLDETYRVRDLWRQQDEANATDRINASVYPHGVYLVRMWPEN